MILLYKYSDYTSWSFWFLQPQTYIPNVTGGDVLFQFMYKSVWKQNYIQRGLSISAERETGEDAWSYAESKKSEAAGTGQAG